MKTKNKLLLGLVAIAFVGALSTSCEKESANVSTVLAFPTMELNEADMQLLVGATFTDPGAKSFSGEEELTVTASGNVDTSKPGLYTVNYSATKEGPIPATATAQRRVLVTATAPANVNLSGEYQAVGRTNKTTITQLAPGLFLASDSWFQASRIPVMFVDWGGGDYKMEPAMQNSVFGNFNGTVTIDASASPISVNFSMRISGGINDGVGWNTVYNKL